MRVAFFGSPAYAVPALEALDAAHDVVLVVTQPDAPAGRGMKLRTPPVAARAAALGRPLAQPSNLKRDAAFAATLRDAHADVAVTVAYGKILPASLLDVPPHGFLNAHASRLPQHRGAAPIQWALIQGDTETAVTIMQTDPGLDTGPVRLVEPVAIHPDDTYPTLADRLAHASADALVEALDRLARGTLPSTPQDDAAATYAPLLVKDDGALDWTASATAIWNRFRGVIAWPGTRTRIAGTTLKIDALAPASTDARAADGAADAAPGTVLRVDDGGVLVACGDGAVRLERVTPAGKPSMPAADWARGARVAPGDRADEVQGDAHRG
ncbi:MAG: methionyl-tRNA formyltransferase [Trueperaceae bacterium]|nr:methionyl-tRNA formyltransferase [Trueperaceae bacterium]